LNFALIDLFSPHEDNITQQIKGVLERGWFKGRKANIVVSHPSIIHRLITLPPMPEEEMGMIVGREVKSQPDEVFFDWQIIRGVEEKGIKKKEVLIAIAPSAEVNQQISLVEGVGLRCEILTTIPLALLSSLKFIRDGEKGAIAFLYLGMDRGYLIFVREGKWCFCREFLWGGEDLTISLERLLAEIKRSLHYFKQHFRGEELERIVIGGEAGEDLDVVKRGLQENLGVDAEKFNSTYGLDLTPIKGRIKDWENVSPTLAIVLGLVGQYHQDGVINLLSLQARRRYKELKARVVTVSLTIIILLGLVVSYGGLSQSLKSYNKILRQKKAALEEFQPLLKEAKILEEKRELYNKSPSLLKCLDKTRTPWLRVLQYLSLIVPDEMVFHSLKAERMEDRWQLIIKGKIVAPDSYTVQKNFNQFYSQFRDSPSFPISNLCL
jgi:Tfp pilus assembly PilM family ATPase